MKSILKIFAVCVAILLFGCKTQKHVVYKDSSESTTVDSFQYREEVKVDTVKIQRDTVRLYIPVSLFKDSSFTYTEKTNGRAKVTFEKRGKDTVVIAAECDSLEKLIITKDKIISSLKQQIKDASKTKEVVKVVQPVFWRFVAYIALGCLAVIAFLFILPKIKQIPIWQKVLKLIKLLKP